MIICAAGDIHGAIDRLYAEVASFERALGVQFDWVLQVGDFGVWPDPGRIDSATRKHGGAGDFPAWHAERRPVPRPTLFIKGNHEDVAWLAERGGAQILPGLWHLRNGGAIRLAPTHLMVGGIGGCYAEADYAMPSAKLKQAAKRHFTREEVDALSRRGHLDLILFHDAPAGIQFGHKVSATEGLADVVARCRPRLVLFGHHHRRVDAEIAGVRCMGLNRGGAPGSLVALSVEEGSKAIEVLGEWPLELAAGDAGAQEAGQG